MLAQIICIPFLPLIAAILTGLTCRVITKKFAHTLTIGSVLVSFLLAAKILVEIWNAEHFHINETLYTFATFGDLKLQIGFLIDKLTALMMVIVTFVSLMVHIYTIGYMQDDAGYCRFFSYISLFTFAMLILVMANNFLQLFFGWEAVGVVSYLLIGFWFTKESAVYANLKAFLVNRVGDLGFLLGIAAIFYIFHTLDYLPIFEKVTLFMAQSNFFELGEYQIPVIELATFLLFIGAMGKSAQIPLHVWLPDSMEGPTPISALIHAATMVTAGVFMVARLSPLFEYADWTRTFILHIGTMTCFLMGILGLVQKDIKRIIAYSTLSQLGYMVAGLGASAYSISIFHLATHAFFKALLFLGAGSVIIAMHHEQSIEKMGGLKKYLPITFITMLIGTLALVGFPGFSGFYSKELIIEAVHSSNIYGKDFAWVLLTAGVFVTSLYSFRLLFKVFFTAPRFDEHTASHLHEPGAVITGPLILLAIPSVIAGAIFVTPVVQHFFEGSIYVMPSHDSIFHLREMLHSPSQMALHGFKQIPFILGVLGALVAWFSFIKYPKFPLFLSNKFKWLTFILENNYGFDWLNQKLLVPFVRLGAAALSFAGDRVIIDGMLVNGTAKAVGRGAEVFRHLQSGYLYHYAFTMFVGMILLFWWLVS